MGSSMILKGEVDPRIRQVEQSRERVDGVRMAIGAAEALSREKAGEDFHKIAETVRWPRRGGMTPQEVTREALTVARFFDSPIFDKVSDSAPGRFVEDLCRRGVPWHVFLKAVRQKTWRAGSPESPSLYPEREGEPISRGDVAECFDLHLNRDAGRPLTVAVVNAHFGYAPPQIEKAGGLERTGQIGMEL